MATKNFFDEYGICQHHGDGMELAMEVHHPPPSPAALIFDLEQPSAFLTRSTHTSKPLTETMQDTPQWYMRLNFGSCMNILSTFISHQEPFTEDSRRQCIYWQASFNKDSQSAVASLSQAWQNSMEFVRLGFSVITPDV